MSYQPRPGGLTALAVLNFIFGGLALLSTLTPMLASLASQAPNMPEEQRAQLEALTSLGSGWMAFMVASGAIGGVLLIVSGIGYLQQKKFLGRTLGNVCAVFRIVVTAAMIAWLPAELRSGSILSILSFIYPALTLVLLNTTFKEDLTR